MSRFGIVGQQDAQGQDASSWGPQFVNHGITAMLANGVAGLVEANDAIAKLPQRGHEMRGLRHRGIEIGEGGHR